MLTRSYLSPFHRHFTTTLKPASLKTLHRFHAVTSQPQQQQQRTFAAAATNAMAVFERLIRFRDTDGTVRYGDLGAETPTREICGKEVEVLEGGVEGGFRKSGGKARVEELLSPLEVVAGFLCVGLNYRRHAEECNVSVHESTLLQPK